MNEIEWIGNHISEQYNNNDEDMATKLRRYIVRNHGMEEYDINIDAPENQNIEDTDDEVWKIRHNIWHKPFNLSIRRDVLGRGEPKLILNNIKEFLEFRDWVVTNSELSNNEFKILVSPK